MCCTLTLPLVLPLLRLRYAKRVVHPTKASTIASHLSLFVFLYFAFAGRTNNPARINYSRKLEFRGFCIFLVEVAIYLFPHLHPEDAYNHMLDNFFFADGRGVGQVRYSVVVGHNTRTNTTTAITITHPLAVQLGCRRLTRHSR